MVMFGIALIATVLAFVQNMIMFGFGMKEGAIFSSPLSFTWICLTEIEAIWMGYFCASKFLRRGRIIVLAGWVVIVLAGAELVLPVSYFTNWVQHAMRENVLNHIELVGTSIEPLKSDQSDQRFSLTYTLRFPRTAPYLTFPAYVGPQNNRVFGEYDTKLHPEYYNEDHVFEVGKPYSFTVTFDVSGKQFDFSKEKVNIDICDGRDYFMACRIIAISINNLPTR
jgi:hypothetical protein